MRPILHTLAAAGLALLLATPSLKGQNTAASSSDTTTTDWEALLDSVEETADWAADPLADLDLGVAEDPASLIFAASAALGYGHSDNYLKRVEKAASAYRRAEADAWLTWFPGERHTLTGLLFAEGVFYDADNGVSSEYLALLQGRWVVSGAGLDYGSSLQVYLSDQIYDASLATTSAPLGESIGQNRTLATLFLDLFPSRRDRLQPYLSVERVDYEIDAEDYFEPGLGIEWERQWSKSLRSLSEATILRADYRSGVALQGTGFAVPGSPLMAIHRLKLQSYLYWQPPQHKWISASAGAGLQWDDDQTGDYESRQRVWTALSLRLDYRQWDLRLSHRWSEVDYAYRQALTFTSDPTTALQIERSWRLELGYDLPWSLKAVARAEFNSLDSRDPEESYRERRLEALIEWSY